MRPIVIGVGVLLLAVPVLIVGGLFAMALLDDTGKATTWRLHSQVRPGMSYTSVIDLTAKEPTALALCEERTSLPAAPCRVVRVEGRGHWLTSHSFPVTFDDKGVIISVGAPAYDVW